MSPLVIGVAGGTGSGKSTVAAKIVEGLPRGTVSVLDHDSYYRDRSDLSLAMREALNYDHPDSLETDLLVQHLRTLKSGTASGALARMFVTGVSPLMLDDLSSGVTPPTSYRGRRRP